MTEQPEQLTAPEFEAKFFWAFVTLLLYKVGGVECISQEQLEKFAEEKRTIAMEDIQAEPDMARV